MENDWTEVVSKRVKELEKAIFKKDDEIRILKLRLATAKKILDDIAELAIRIN